MTNLALVALAAFLLEVDNLLAAFVPDDREDHLGALNIRHADLQLFAVGNSQDFVNFNVLTGFGIEKFDLKCRTRGHSILLATGL